VKEVIYAQEVKNATKHAIYIYVYIYIYKRHSYINKLTQKRIK